MTLPKKGSSDCRWWASPSTAGASHTCASPTCASPTPGKKESLNGSLMGPTQAALGRGSFKAAKVGLGL